MRTNTAFWDTSAIVPLCCRQAASVRARQLRRNYARMAVWWGCPVEAQSALQRLWAGQVLSAAELQWGLHRLATMRQVWLEVRPQEPVRVLAEALPAQYGLRALDAFQLAAGLVWCRERPRHREFVCLDEKLAAAAEKAGFTVIQCEGEAQPKKKRRSAGAGQANSHWLSYFLRGKAPWHKKLLLPSGRWKRPTLAQPSSARQPPPCGKSGRRIGR